MEYDHDETNLCVPFPVQRKEKQCQELVQRKQKPLQKLYESLLTLVDVLRKQKQGQELGNSNGRFDDVQRKRKQRQELGNSFLRFDDVQRKQTQHLELRDSFMIGPFRRFSSRTNESKWLRRRTSTGKKTFLSSLGSVVWLSLVCTAMADNQCYCPEMMCLERGSDGMIPCTCGSFDVVSWYTTEEYESNGSPFIYFDNINKRGFGYISGEYDIGRNGSLIIKNVSLSYHGQVYTVKFFRNSDSRSDVINTELVVTVTPTPAYPVLNNHVHQHVFLDVNREGTLTCSISGVHPSVNLSLDLIDSSRNGEAEIRHSYLSSTRNTDNTFDVFVMAQYRVDFSAKSLIIRCNVINLLQTCFPSITTAELTFIPDVPQVNSTGIIERDRVHMSVDRAGQLNCFKKSVSEDESLAWKVVSPAFRDKIIFKSEQSKSKNIDGTFDVRLSSEYSVNDYSVELITICCEITGSDVDQHPATTLVDLHFPKVPVIDGCYSMQGVCILNVKQKGTLKCTVRNSRRMVDVTWMLLDTDPSNLVFEEDIVSIQNKSTMFDVSITSNYAVKDKSLTTATVQCVVKDSFSKNPLSSAKVSLVIHTDDSCNPPNPTTSEFHWWFYWSVALLISFTVVYCWTLCYRFQKNKMRRLRRDQSALEAA